MGRRRELEVEVPLFNRFDPPAYRNCTAPYQFDAMARALVSALCVGLATAQATNLCLGVGCIPRLTCAGNLTTVPPSITGFLDVRRWLVRADPRSMWYLPEGAVRVPSLFHLLCGRLLQKLPKPRGDAL